jgi:uncharacterized protein YbjT (DUF2867 family)
VAVSNSFAITRPTDGQTVRLPSALLQPIVTDDVAAALANVAVAEPLKGMVELAGPEAIPLDEVVRQFLKATRAPPARSSRTSKPLASASR